jgi:hypothetical protein
MSNYVRLALCQLIHALGCVAYAFLNGAVVHAYKLVHGGFTSRGVAIGIASYALSGIERIPQGGFLMSSTTRQVPRVL